MRSSRTTASFCSRRQDEGTLALPGVTASAQDHDESPARGNKRSSPTETLAVGHVTVLWGGDDLIGRMKELAKTQTIHRPPTAERIALIGAAGMFLNIMNIFIALLNILSLDFTGSGDK